MDVPTGVFEVFLDYLWPHKCSLYLGNGLAELSKEVEHGGCSPAFLLCCF